jgi:anaerobic magnesium-protoporphyrin IX monomethyl ester cyclase
MKIIIATLNAKFIHTSLALRYLKAYCQKDFDIDICEYTIKDPAWNIVSHLHQQDPDVLGFSCYIWNIEQTITVIQMLKKIKPSLKIVLGGPEVSYDVPYWMNRLPEVDFIVMGEGEATFHHLLQEIATTAKYHFVYGIAYRKAEEVIINATRPKLQLDEIPSPFRFEADLIQLGNRITYFETSRGCPFSCQFCLSSIEVGVRYFDLARTKRELLFLIESGAKLIKFVDRTFNIKRDYALDIFAFLIEHHNGCIFQFEITADIMRPEVLDYLAMHAPPGIFRFEIGVQSTNELTNDLVQRKQNFKKLSHTVNKIRESQNITQHLDLIAGLPKENYDSFRQTFNDVFDLRPEELQLGFLKMLRGTGLRASAEEFGYVYMDHAPYEILGNSDLTFDELIRIKRVEDVLEKYWNAHRMDHTMRYLMNNVFTNAFDFFQAFGDYWEQQGWSKIGHQLEDLFTRLHAFLVQINCKQLHFIEGLMKLDYVINHAYKPRKIWWDDRIQKKELLGYSKMLLDEPQRISQSFVQLQLSEQDLQKHTMLERVSFDLNKYLDTGMVESGSNVMIAYYDPKNESSTQIFAMPLAEVTLSV